MCPCLVGPTRVMAGGQDETPKGTVLADDARQCRCGEDSVLADDHLANPVGARHLHDDREGGLVEVAAIAAEDQSRALEFRTQGVEGGLEQT